MNRKLIIGALTISLLAIIITIGVLMNSLSRPNKTAEQSLPDTCSTGQAAHEQLANSSSARLQKLAQYEQLCHGAATNQLMTFAAMPTTHQEAEQFARDIAVELQEFARFEITPLVVLEPSTTRVNVLTEIRDGLYDGILSHYFTALKNQGITDQQMGVWVLFPEANTPAWSTTDPTVFSANVTKIASLQKQFFPTSKASLLLDSRSYPNHDSSWTHGQLKSLTPYVQAIPAGLIDSFGLQGFPRVSPANSTSKYSQIETKDFLPAHLAREAADILGVKDIWFNTGTFRRLYTDDPAAQIHFNADQRQSILNAVARDAGELKNQSYTVSINLFAEDKSQTSEYVDWSYWQSNNIAQGSDAFVLDRFIRQLRVSDVKFSLYDSIPSTD